MGAQQAVRFADPVDQLVPPPPGHGRLIGLLIGVFAVLALAAVAPNSGVVRPHLAFDGSLSGAAGHGTGTWEFVIENGGWTSATIESFDPDIPTITVIETSFIANDGRETPLDPPATVAAGHRIIVRIKFTYDCADVPRWARSSAAREQIAAPASAAEVAQDATVQARGSLPMSFTVHLGADGIIGLRSDLVDLTGGACDSEMTPP